jgi:TPR repeat protein
MRALQISDAGDDAQALTAIKKFAESGLAAAQYDLGILYLEGKLLDQDLGTANTWFEAAARQGVADAQYKLAHSYRTGRGVSASPEKAFYWYHEAATRGDVEAQSNVAYSYIIGYGTNRSIDEAIRWYMRATEGGDIQSRAALVRVFSATDEDRYDPLEAYKWLSLVLPFADFYDAGAKSEMESFRQRLERQLSEKDRAAARAAANAWQEAHPLVRPPETVNEVETHIQP